MILAHLRTLQFCGALRAKGHAVDETLLASEWKAVDRAKRTAEARMQDAVQPVLLAAAERAAAQIGRLYTFTADTKRRGAEPTPFAAQAFDLDLLTADLLAALDPAVAEALRAGFASGAVRLGDLTLSFDAERQSVVDASRRLLREAESVPETLRGMVDTVVRRGLAANLTPEQIARAIRDVAPEMTANQASLISETTGTAAFEAGQLGSFTEAGADVRWLTRRDGKVRDSHAAMDGEQVKAGETFSNGSQHPDEPRCRCTLLPVIVATKAAPRGRAWRLERDAQIKAEYPDLLNRHGRGVALDRLSEAYSVSTETVRRALGHK